MKQQEEIFECAFQTLDTILFFCFCFFCSSVTLCNFIYLQVQLLIVLTMFGECKNVLIVFSQDSDVSVYNTHINVCLDVKS